MTLVRPKSLSATLDALIETSFFGRTLSHTQRQQAAAWLAGRQGLPGSYAGMFAPTDKDFRDGLTVFTGEWIGTQAGTSHVLGEEACRALILLDVDDLKVRKALAAATAGILPRLSLDRRPGMYCCGICSVSLWRHLAAGGLDRQEERLAAGLRTLKTHRLGNGRWRTFPFWYTLLALSEIDLPASVVEMRYALPVCERYQRLGKSPRRRAIAERVLAH